MAFKRKFNVGDKVTIISNSKEFKGLLGMVGMITNICRYPDSKGVSRVYYAVVPDNDQYSTIYALSGDIQLMNSTDKKSTITNEQLNRISIELDELLDRKDKLEKFINSNRFLSLDDLTRTELQIQLDAMSIYYRILNSRHKRLLSDRSNTTLYMD